MKAIFSPGPAYSDPSVRQTAGWVHILDIYREALDELGYEVFVPRVHPDLIDASSTVSRITSYDLVAASQLPVDADLFLGPPGYSLAQIMRVEGDTVPGESLYPKTLFYVWNNADWWRDEQLAAEYKRFGAKYDLSPTWRWINRTALEASDHVIACSPWVKKTHGKIVQADRISISFWGVDSQRFHPAEREPDVFRILFVGGDPIRKGLWYLIDALRGLGSMIEPYEFWIVGCAPIQNPPPFWRQFGMVPHEQMPYIYQQCSVLVCPTLEDGIALCVQEAMSSGLVPIASPDAAEVFEDGCSGIKVDFRDSASIASALVRLRQHPEQRLELARAARALAETQTWERTKSDFKEIIQRVMNEGKLPFESDMPWLTGRSKHGQA